MPIIKARDMALNGIKDCTSDEEKAFETRTFEVTVPKFYFNVLDKLISRSKSDKCCNNHDQTHFTVEEIQSNLIESALLMAVVETDLFKEDFEYAKKLAKTKESKTIN